METKDVVIHRPRRDAEQEVQFDYFCKLLGLPQDRTVIHIRTTKEDKQLPDGTNIYSIFGLAM